MWRVDETLGSGYRPGKTCKLASRGMGCFKLQPVPNIDYCDQYLTVTY
jgi:hypothetical protein